MSIYRSGSTKKYSDNWAAAFGKKKSERSQNSGGTGTAKKPKVKKSATKKSAAKKAVAKKAKTRKRS